MEIAHFPLQIAKDRLHWPYQEQRRIVKFFYTKFLFVHRAAELSYLMLWIILQWNNINIQPKICLLILLPNDNGEDDNNYHVNNNAENFNAIVYD